MTPAIDITAEQRRTILTLLERHLPGTTAWVHGSRVQRTSRPTSDLDLVVFATPEQDRRVGDLREAFEESDLPFPVDLFVWDEIPENFHKKIKSEYEVLIKTNHRDSECGWQEATLGECAFLVKSSVYPESCGESHYIGLEHIGEGSLSLLGHGKASDVESVKSRFLCGDILFGKLRPYFRKVIRARFDGICSTDIWVIRPSDGIVAEYLFYVISSEEFVDFATQGTEGTRMPRAQWEHTSRFQIRIPPLPEQHAIARTLGALDDKIELNRRMNETLEAMACTLFKSWFVDFDPVRAKMEGRDTGLPNRIADLFPDRLVDSEIGEIPEGWEISEIGEEVDACGGATPSTKESVYWVEGKLHWATPKDLAKLRSPVLLETDKKITDAGIRKISTGLLPIGTVLLSSRAPIGYLAIAEVPTAINQGFIAMVCRKRLPNLYVLFWCHENLDYIKNISGGSTFSEINKKSFRPIPVLVPLEEILTVYEDAIRPLYNRIVANAKESVSLTQIRDILLPRLISGEVRLGEAIGRLGSAA